MAAEHTHGQTTGAPSTQEYVDALVYSDDRATRAALVRAVGRRAGKGLPLLRWHEAATHAGVLEKVAENRYALLVLDSEAAKVGGMAISRELKTSMYECPPIIVTIARPQDAWLATWCEADAYIAEPFDPVEVQEAVARVLRGASREVTA